jgi:hypothetical protein
MVNSELDSASNDIYFLNMQLLTCILGSIAGPCDFLPAWSDGPTNFKKSDIKLLHSIVAASVV